MFTPVIFCKHEYAPMGLRVLFSAGLRMSTQGHPRILHSNPLGMTCHLYFRCKAAFALPIAYPDLAEG